MNQIDKLLVATGNMGKINEFKTLFKNIEIDLSFIPDFDIKDPIEDADSFEGNALLKAMYYSNKTDMIALADDSGLCVDLLDGNPGIYSARWATEKRDFNIAVDRIEKELKQKNLNSSKAHFICSLCLYYPSGEYQVFTGKTDGIVRFPKSGAEGFGYDSIFIADNSYTTFADMSMREKLSLSPRYKALKEMMSQCFQTQI